MLDLSGKFDSIRVLLPYNKGDLMRSIIISLLLLSTSAMAADGFTFSSESIKEGAMLDMKYVYNSFGCSGKNVSPAFHWSNPPAGTKSYVLTMYDPDAPTGSGWWHWMVYNIPAEVTSLREGESFKTYKEGDKTVNFGKVGQARTDFGSSSYGGPCPPPGAPHHYVFTLYALKVAKLDLNKNSSGAMVGFNANANVIEKKTITVMFGR